jgi:antitoxin component YwqK of YwqJK toxin-antitoxin module
MAAEFLSSVGTAYQVDRILSEAVNELVLLSPALRLHESIILRLHQADKRNVRTTLLYGKDRNQFRGQKWYRNFKNLRIIYHDKLNTCVYRNEKEMILTSMGLDDLGSGIVHDMGVLIVKLRDRRAFDDGIYEQEILIESAEEVFAGKNYVRVEEKTHPEEIIREMPFLTYFGIEDRTLVNGKVKAPSGKFYSPEMEFYNDGTIKSQGFKKTRQRHGEWIFYTYEGFVREVVIYDNGNYVNKIFCDYENPARTISKYYLLFGIGNSVKKLYDRNISDLYFDSRIEDYTGSDRTRLFYHVERFVGKRSVFEQPETFQDMVDQLYAALYE